MSDYAPMKATVWWQSKTFWFNVITFTLAILSLTEFQDLIPITFLKYITFITIVGNIVLRMFFTVGPITATEKTANLRNR